MTIWAFSKHGVATVWKIDVGRNENVNSRCVMRDGTVREIDGEGDVEMSDAPSPSPDILQPPMPLIQETYDGSAPFSPVVQANLVQYDSEGDLLMDKLPDSQQFVNEESEPEEDCALELDGVPKVWCNRERWSRRFYQRPMDLVEEVTGVSRIDVEIR
jgi:hypothetical protein